MKREKFAAAIQAVWLSFLITLGAMGSMVTGLELNAAHFGALVLLWAAVCLLTALVSQVRFGGWVLLAALGFCLFLAAEDETFRTQTLEMLCKITNYYDNAYGWGFLRAPRMGRGAMDLPLGLLGSCVALAACRSLCGGKSGLGALLPASIPLIACVVVTDTVPRERYLYLWLLAFVLVLLSSSARRENLRWGVHIANLALVPTALSLGLLFLAVPREGYHNQPEAFAAQLSQWFGDFPENLEQVSQELPQISFEPQPETIRLDAAGPRNTPATPVLEVTAPVSGTLYLRGRHYDTYTGTGWTASEDQTELLQRPRMDRELGQITIRTRRVQDILYLPYYPEKNTVLREGAGDNADRLREYSFTQYALAEYWRELTSYHHDLVDLSAGTADPERWLRLPEGTRHWAYIQWAGLEDRGRSATEIAGVIGGFVRNSADYSLNTPRMPQDHGDFARWFLEESDTGYCVHFATAATVLLRAAGVQARYVEGYLLTAEAGQAVTVTADQAHAWVEYFEPLVGAWIPLEVTPSSEEVPESATTNPRETAPDATAEEETAVQEQEDPEKPTINGRFPWTLVLALLLPAGLEGQRWLRLRCRARKRRTGAPNERALALWREVEMLSRLGKASAPEQARAIALKAKYSPHRISRQELAELEESRTAALEALKASPWYQKILHRWIFGAG